MNSIETIEQNEAKALAISVADETQETMQAVNNTLHVAGTRAHFQAHYSNAKLDIAGLVALVKDILREGQAEFPRNAHDTELRKIVIACSMFTEEIYAKAQERFFAGSDRGKRQAIKNVLSTYAKGQIAKVKLSPKEDQPRTSDKPRCKWYLISTAD